MQSDNTQKACGCSCHTQSLCLFEMVKACRHSSWAEQVKVGLYLRGPQGSTELCEVAANGHDLRMRGANLKKQQN